MFPSEQFFTEKTDFPRKKRLRASCLHHETAIQDLHAAYLAKKSIAPD